MTEPTRQLAEIATTPQLGTTGGVHWVQYGFVAIPETTGHGDECGIDAALAYLHVKKGYSASLAQANALRMTAIAHGWMDTVAFKGMTVMSIAALLRYLGVEPTQVVPWGQVNLDEFHQTIRNIYQSHVCVLYETHNASALPGSQQGVQNHFVSIWGEDSQAGYYTANGDTLYALEHTTPIPPVWYTWSNILASEPMGYLVLPAV